MCCWQHEKISSCNWLRKTLYPKEGIVSLNYNENIILQEKSADKNKSLHITCNSLLQA